MGRRRSEITDERRFLIPLDGEDVSDSEVFLLEHCAQEEAELIRELNDQ